MTSLSERLEALADTPIDDNLKYIQAADELMREAAAALEAALSKTAPTQPSEEKAVWLIERKNFNADLRPHWYAETPRGDHWWTPDAHLAKPFQTRSEAAEYPAYKLIADDPNIGLTEHVFMSVSKTAVGDAARDVLAERRRQVEQEGWTPEHDDKHTDNELSRAAGCYALGVTAYWPWDQDWWKPSDRRRNLVKAGALILAEIERLDRLPARPNKGAADA